MCLFERVKSLSLCLERLPSGGDSFWSIRPVLVVMLSASAVGRFFNTVSILVTVSSVG